MSIKTILRGNKFTYFFIVQVRRIQYFFLYYLLFNIQKCFRVNNIYKNCPYERIKQLKGKHKGERCFIVATGPSLTVEDLEKLRSEVTFSMNSIFLAFEETNWRPTYFGIQDRSVYNRFVKEIDTLDVQGIFISDMLSKNITPLPLEDYYIFPINNLNHLAPHKKYHSKFSDNAFAVVYSGYSITYSLMQIAVYMGFEEIYLLGADCNYSSDMRHHFKEYGHVDPSFAEAHDQMVAAYKVAKEYAVNHQVNIYNATRGGMLEVFDRVDLDVVLSEKRSNVVSQVF